MYLNRGSYHNHQFLKKETIDLLLVNQVPAADKPRSLGWDFKYDVATQLGKFIIPYRLYRHFFAN